MALRYHLHHDARRMAIPGDCDGYFFSRIIGWAMFGRMTKALVISPLNRAFQTQAPTKGLIRHEIYANRAVASRSILEYIVSFYNYERIHSYIEYLSPIEFERR